MARWFGKLEITALMDAPDEKSAERLFHHVFGVETDFLTQIDDDEQADYWWHRDGPETPSLANPPMEPEKRSGEGHVWEGWDQEGNYTQFRITPRGMEDL